MLSKLVRLSSQSKLPLTLRGCLVTSEWNHPLNRSTFGAFAFGWIKNLGSQDSVRLRLIQPMNESKTLEPLWMVKQSYLFFNIKSLGPFTKQPLSVPRYTLEWFSCITKLRPTLCELQDLHLGRAIGNVKVWKFLVFGDKIYGKALRDLISAIGTSNQNKDEIHLWQLN